MKPTTTDILVVEPKPNALAVRDPEALIKFALEKGTPVDVMERLLAMRRELKTEQAKEAFDSAMAAFQAECPVIEKRKDVMNKDNRTVRYRFAPLDDIVTQVKPLLQKHGFSYSITAETSEKRVKVICKITHSAGHSDASTFEVPIDPQAFMNEQQKFASALTYSKRYAFCNALGILTGDEDVDGRLQREKPQGPNSMAGDKAPSGDDIANKRKLVDLLRAKCIPGTVGYNLDERSRGAIEQWLIDEAIIADDEHLVDLVGDKLSKAVAALERKVKQ